MVLFSECVPAKKQTRIMGQEATNRVNKKNLKATNQPIILALYRPGCVLGNRGQAWKRIFEARKRAWAE